MKGPGYLLREDGGELRNLLGNGERAENKITNAVSSKYKKCYFRNSKEGKSFNK